MPRARARHILVKTEADCDKLMEQLSKGANFAVIAQTFSTCPSGKKAEGDLGVFEPGQMVKPFNEVCFNEALNVVHKVETKFGWHLVEVTARVD